jgi:hypothetical protein
MRKRLKGFRKTQEIMGGKGQKLGKKEVSKGMKIRNEDR